MHLYPIHIAFCINDKYVPYTTVVIRSIVENNRNNAVDIHIVTDRISDAEVKLLNESIDGFGNAHIHIYIIDDKRISDLKSGVWTRYTWYRVLLPEVLPSDVSRVLYLDADTVVASALDELFDLDMEGKAVAGSPDPKAFSDEPYERCGYEREKEYVCAGVLLFNLDYWRRNNLMEKTIEVARRNRERFVFNDQDAINYICRDSKVVLPFRYGTPLWFFYMDELYGDERYCKELYDSFYAPSIIHYMGCHPFRRDISIRHVMDGEWWRYNKMLRHPAGSIRKVGLWLAIKQRIYKALYPERCPRQITAADIEAELSAHLPIKN